MWLVLAASPALAGDCADYSLDALLDDVGRVESRLAAARSTAEASTELRDRLPCLGERLPAVLAPRVLRAVGAGLHEIGAEAAQGWLAAAAHLAPGLRFGADEAPGREALLAAWDAAALAVAAALPRAVDDHALAPGDHWLDGVALVEPAALPGVPHIYQFRPPEGVLHTSVVDGPRFPEQALVLTGASEVPRGVAGPSPRDGPILVPPPADPIAPVEVRPERWPTERVAVVATGAGVLAAAGVVYGLSARSQSRFFEADTRELIDRRRAATNRLAAGATGLASLGASLVGFGVLFYLVDGEPRPTLDLRF